jgi:alkylation response protein AidB-like acyl-CoA dehydrogenase
MSALENERTRVLDAVEELLHRFPPTATDTEKFLAAQYDAGLAWLHFPPGRGGLGLARSLQTEVTERLAAAGGPNAELRNAMGYHIAAPTILAWGTEAQQQRYLPPLFSGTEYWCQLFSEPGSGSDAAAASCRAVRDGDEWVVNGQKVWTSMAHLSDRGLLLVRTEPDVAKHRGLTYFVLDVHAPGVDVRPLRQMTGDAEFNEVYLTDVRIPDADRLGPVGEGWQVAVSSLMNERVGFAADDMLKGPIDAAMTAYRDHRPDDAELRSRLIDLWVQTRVGELTNVRAAANLAKGTAGPEGSIGKVNFADISQLGYDLAMDILGPEALLYESYAMRELDGTKVVSTIADPRRAYLRARGNSIEGGTSEIMRNILGERVLGLPPDVRVDKDTPWSQLPRN